MPKLEPWRQVMQKARQQRDQQVRELRAQGRTLEAIGRELGLTKQRVHQLLNERRSAQP